MIFQQVVHTACFFMHMGRPFLFTGAVFCREKNLRMALLSKLLFYKCSGVNSVVTVYDVNKAVCHITDSQP